jgi:hypothetical protein
MSPDSHNDPTPVMKFVAGVLLFLTISALVALLIWKGTAITWPVIVALAVPCCGLLIMLFDGVREKVLDVAAWLPFVKYRRPGDAP